MKISEWNSLSADAKKKRGPTESGSDGSMLEGGSQTLQGAVFVVVVLSLSPSTPSSPLRFPITYQEKTALT